MCVCAHTCVNTFYVLELERFGINYLMTISTQPQASWSLRTSNAYPCDTTCWRTIAHYFANKGPSSQSYGFSSSHIWMWGLDHKESWVLKNGCFWTVVLEKTLESPLDCKEINQSILKEICPEYSLEGLMLRLKLQYFVQLMRRADSFEKTLMLGRIEGRREGNNRGWDGWMASPTHWMWDFRSWWWKGKPGVLQSTGSQRVGYDWANELNWTEVLQRGARAENVGRPLPP